MRMQTRTRRVRIVLIREIHTLASIISNAISSLHRNARGAPSSSSSSSKSSSSSTSVQRRRAGGGRIAATLERRRNANIDSAFMHQRAPMQTLRLHSCVSFPAANAIDCKYYFGQFQPAVYLLVCGITLLHRQGKVGRGGGGRRNRQRGDRTQREASADAIYALDRGFMCVHDALSCIVRACVVQHVYQIQPLISLDIPFGQLTVTIRMTVMNDSELVSISERCELHDSWFTQVYARVFFH